MQEKYLYEYAIIRVLPIVEREEYLNVGVVVVCKKENFIKVHFTINEQKLVMFSKEIDLEQIRMNLQAFEKIASGDVTSGPIALMDAVSRFRWLTAVRSSAIQTSRPHPGMSNDLQLTAKKLFEELVL